MLRFNADLKTLVWMGVTTALLIVQWRADSHNWALYGVYIYLSISVAVMAHNHNHVRMWRHKALNHLTDLWITLFYGFPVFGWIPTHNANHHKHNNRDPDYTKTWRFWEANNLLTMAVYPAVSAYHQQRAIARYLVALRRRNRGLFYAALSQIVALIVWVGGALLLDWQKALVYVVIPQQFSLTTVLIFNYLQHVHADEENDWNHSRNFTGALLNFLLFNNGYHTVHHLTPGLHWSQAPAAHRRIQHNIHPSLNVSSAPQYMVRTFFLAPFVRTYRTRGMRVGGWKPRSGDEPADRRHKPWTGDRSGGRRDARGHALVEPGTWARYNAILDRMDGPARVRTALELSEAVREIRLAGLRARCPHLDPRQLIARLVAEDYGIDLPGEMSRRS